MLQFLSSHSRIIVRLPFKSSNRIVASKNYTSLKEKYTSEQQKVPTEPFIEHIPPSSKIKIDEDTISHLENLSLVNCANREGIQILQDAIQFAEKILTINTSNTSPMYTVLENSNLKLREDVITVKNSQKDILKNSSSTFEEYFVAPPGNVPLEARNNLLYK